MRANGETSAPGSDGRGPGLGDSASWPAVGGALIRADEPYLWAKGRPPCAQGWWVAVCEIDKIPAARLAEERSVVRAAGNKGNRHARASDLDCGQGGGASASSGGRIL